MQVKELEQQLAKEEAEFEAAQKQAEKEQVGDDDYGPSASSRLVLLLRFTCSDCCSRSDSFPCTGGGRSGGSGGGQGSSGSCRI